jgi:AcrR family transcriptional regulator
MMTGTKDDNLRALIIEKAAAQFFNYGFANTTTQQIAEELEISKKTIYKYFASKEELLFAALEQQHREMLGRIDALIGDTHKDFLVKLKEVTATIGMYKAKISPQLIRDLQKMGPDQFKHKQSPYQRLIPYVERLLNEGVQKGVIRSDVDQQLIILVVAGAFENMLCIEVLSRMDFSFQEILDAIIEVITEGILTDKARKKYLNRMVDDNTAIDQP